MTISGIAPSPNSTRRFYTGQIVVDTISGGVYEVLSHPQKNVKAENAKGQVWTIGPGRLRLATEAESHDFRDSKVVVDFFYPGNVVRFKDGKKAATAGLFVVTKDTPTGYNLVRLGGDVSGRYFRSVPAASIEKVDVTKVGQDGYVNV